jgi:hypothetical protein
MPEVHLDTQQFVREVKNIPLNSISPSASNPRGTVEKDESFDRLVSSISEVGILVPLVVKELQGAGPARFELVDGERRYWAAKELAKDKVPAHVLKGHSSASDLRKLMFHLHMMREQWGALAQCRSLDEIYPSVAKGLKLSEKPKWIARLSEETGMTTQLARDRVHVLCWPASLKREIYDIDQGGNAPDIYSYVLAIEASVIEPSVRAFPHCYNGSRPVDSAANEFRQALLRKTLYGIKTGAVRSRDQIRSVIPLFSPELQSSQKRIAEAIFRDLVGKPAFQFEDAKAAIIDKLPDASKQPSLTSAKLIAEIKRTTKYLNSFTMPHQKDTTKAAKATDRLKENIRTALADLENAARSLKDRI